ncbi:hypothetical protein PHYSODRAFT_306159 [Phytophthora sojae]|uniref:Uncharacterized protein n=1 Tax=Phytophthora sojae (strain P6497) TaxID=1094619 RepID=G5A849_PHYSP|nr:hypothetical protein PHYSODRAFT_306159 [Phytophthora sojae]EGZ08075.1 hypothetical protein PHYSODRAFT_306159 [Phytophthora sojae]|eukprot:XP_009536247.1 hypothetical protein PHYSODRAFT_306159 [Phytophthora sojae]
MIQLVREYTGSEDVLVILEQGWARRPAKGCMYGANYVAFYKADIARLFQQGVANKSDKLGPRRMLESIQEKYPWRFDFPSSSQIRAEISKLMKAQKETVHQEDSQNPVRNASGSSAEGNPPGKRSSKRKIMDSTYVTFINRLMDSYPDLLAAQAIQHFRTAFPQAQSVEDATIRNRVNRIKRQKTG